MLDVSAIAPERVRPLACAEYERLVELGAFDDERVELLDGFLVTMSPQGARHAEVVGRLNRLFTIALADRACVRIQSPLAAGDQSLPEPDLAVVPLGDYTRGHPDRGLLVIEVADSSLSKDRIKAGVYAAAGVVEYWIVNLIDDVVEVHVDAAGDRYRNMSTHGLGATIASREFPDVQIRIDELLQ
jgi:Uma2 family endonuclease